MHIDANTNIGPTIYDDFEFDPTLDKLENVLADIDIDGAVVCPLKPPSFDFDEVNEQLAAELNDRDLWYAIGRIDPRVNEAPEQVHKAINDYGCHGVKLHPWEESFPLSSPIVEPVLEAAADLGVPVWIHAGYPNVSHALSVRRIAQTFPEVPFVLTHSSQLDISGGSLADVELMAQETSNTYFELSGIYRHDFIQNIVEMVGSKRVLFGSNAPYFNPQVEQSRVKQSDLPAEAKVEILGGSIHSLLG